jgi:hypothetical protein
MKPPALPIAPTEYDPEYQNALLRILTQYLSQVSSDDLKNKQKTDISEVLFWLS